MPPFFKSRGNSFTVFYFTQRLLKSSIHQPKPDIGSAPVAADKKRHMLGRYSLYVTGRPFGKALQLCRGRLLPRRDKSAANPKSHSTRFLKIPDILQADPSCW